MNEELFLPYYEDEVYLREHKDHTIFFTRFIDDFQNNCFLFKKAASQAITDKCAKERSRLFDLCYIYDMFHFENKEFTLEGFEAINSDIKRIINSGFKYILVSNPYIIELLCNEYEKDINVVISSQLEINSVQSKIFFDVLNKTSNISHIVVSQNYKCSKEIDEMLKAFSNMKLVIEPDRAASVNQIVHENYYNMVYGYYNKGVQNHIKKFLDENKKYFKKSCELIWDIPNIAYKYGELNVGKGLLLKNIENFKNKEYNKIKIIDFDLW